MLGAVSFFFQAEDGIRDLTVTGVQTCALPISGNGRRSRARQTAGDRVGAASPAELNCISESARPQRALRLGSSRAGGAGSGEGRGGEEGRFWGGADYLKKKKHRIQSLVCVQVR